MDFIRSCVYKNGNRKTGSHDYNQLPFVLMYFHFTIKNTNPYFQRSDKNYFLRLGLNKGPPALKAPGIDFRLLPHNAF